MHRYVIVVIPNLGITSKKLRNKLTQHNNYFLAHLHATHVRDKDMSGVSVCPSVRLLHAGIQSEVMNTGRCRFLEQPRRLYFLTPNYVHTIRRMVCEGDKNAAFRPISRCISETTEDRYIFRRFYPPKSRLKPSQLVFAWDLGQKSWSQKTRVSGLPDSESYVYLSPLDTSV